MLLSALLLHTVSWAVAGASRKSPGNLIMYTY